MIRILTYLILASLSVHPIFGEEGPNLFRFKQGEKWGFMDRSGNTVISPKYEWVSDFQEGLAVVELPRESPVIIDTKENKILILDPGHFPRNIEKGQFVDFDPKTKEYGIRKIDGTWNFKKSIRIENQLREGKAIYCIGDKYGFIRADGSLLTEAEYDFAENFGNGFAKVGKFKEGFTRRKHVFGECNYKPSKFPVQPYLYTFIDENGKATIPFDEEYQSLSGNYLLKYSGTKGSSILNFPDLSSVGIVHKSIRFGENNSYVFEDDVLFGIGFLNPNKETILKFRLRRFLSPTQIQYSASGKYGILDTKGRIVKKAVFDRIEIHSGGLLFCQWGQYEGYMDLEGNIVKKWVR